MANRGSVFLIPSYLSEQNDASFIAPMVQDVIKNTSLFLVENVRTARRFISSLKLGIDIPSLQFELLDKKTSPQELSRMIKPVLEGKNIGIISEAGLPGLADPGSLAVAYAHRNDIQVIPLPGASAIQTALISSGFNGQQFTFHGYLPIQKNDRAKAIKSLETDLQRTGYTQVFMETPFRNMHLLDDLFQHLGNNTLLHIASDVFGANELVKTKTIGQWKSLKPNLHKIPTVFCIGQMS
ncbi:SAM-dependent methyltransferase [Marinoscillum sp. MHG1-6]|uniref:SAM-dependent methyltransferase n=1 Tax=Marinoscillum sp. MHG1-6 TaxID=2959627 RepID=UPI0021579526|nr:SAM-dependent methyltransferase [Marinoscillum sp. MHG1-6]